jgi:hypothetical protein
MCSTIMRMVSPAVCQPEATSPPKGVAAPAAASRWKGCGSNCAAKATIASAVTRASPNATTSPSEKSSR